MQKATPNDNAVKFSTPLMQPFANKNVTPIGEKQPSIETPFKIEGLS